MNKYVISTLILASFLVGFPLASQAVDAMNPEVNIFDTGLTRTGTFLAFDHVFDGGADVALADTDGDGQDEIIVGAGRNGGPMVQVFEADGTLRNQFFVYDEWIHTGIKVAAGDLDHDGKAEIVTGVEYGGGPHVRVFEADGTVKFTPGFFAFDSGFRGGVDVEVGDYNGDGKMEIVAAAGPSGSPHVREFDRYGNYLGKDYHPFADDNKGGIALATANVDGGEDDELVMAINSAGEGWVKVYKHDGTVLGEWKNFEGIYTGVAVGAADIDNDGKDEIAVTPRQNAGPQVVWYEGYGAPVKNFFAYNQDFRGGLRVAGGDLNGDGTDEVVTVPGKNRAQGRPDFIRYIETDISDQVTRVYEYGELIREFKVSTGIDRYPTPLGQYAVIQKVYMKDYEWTYGPDNPDNYDLPNVKWNLRYNGPYFLHYAYWHNNFGQKMSHGCTNIDAANSEWIYNWANVGDVVINKE